MRLTILKTLGRGLSSFIFFKEANSSSLWPWSYYVPIDAREDMQGLRKWELLWNLGISDTRLFWPLVDPCRLCSLTHIKIIFKARFLTFFRARKHTRIFPSNKDWLYITGLACSVMLGCHCIAFPNSPSVYGSSGVRELYRRGEPSAIYTRAQNFGRSSGTCPRSLYRSFCLSYPALQIAWPEPMLSRLYSVIKRSGIPVKKMNM